MKNVVGDTEQRPYLVFQVARLWGPSAIPKSLLIVQNTGFVVWDSGERLPTAMFNKQLERMCTMKLGRPTGWGLCTCYSSNDNEVFTEFASGCGQ